MRADVIYCTCRQCGRTLTGDYEKRAGICAGLIMCKARKQAREASEPQRPAAPEEPRQPQE